MSIPNSLDRLDIQKFKESSTTANQPGVVVVNPDGSNVGASVTVTADTEFSAAAALADNTANPTTTLVGAMAMGFDGTTWDRIRGTAEDGLNVQGGVAHDAADTGNPVKIGGKATDPTSLPTAVASGDRANLATSLQGETLVYLSRLLSGEDSTNNLLVTINKPVAASTYAPTRFADFGASATLNVKATAGNVFSVSCHNENAADRYLQLHNTATTPAVGATPLYSFLVPTNSQTIVGTDFFTQSGGYFSTGIAFAFSTTKDTYTAGTASEQSSIVHYV